MNQSEQINEIAAALAKAQTTITNVSKDKDIDARGEGGRGYVAKYADLAAIVSAVRPALSANGIAYVQGCTGEYGKVVLVTKLLHGSGQWLSSEMHVKPNREGPQGFGSALTYARRYALAAICGVAPEDEDDDGNAAEEPAKQPRKARGARAENDAPSPEVAKFLDELAAAPTLEAIAEIATGLRPHAKGDQRAEDEIAIACVRVIDGIDAEGLKRIMAGGANSVLAAVKIPEGPAKVRVRNAIDRKRPAAAGETGPRNG